MDDVKTFDLSQREVLRATGWHQGRGPVLGPLKLGCNRRPRCPSAGLHVEAFPLATLWLPTTSGNLWDPFSEWDPPDPRLQNRIFCNSLLCGASCIWSPHGPGVSMGSEEQLAVGAESQTMDTALQKGEFSEARALDETR